MPEDYHNPKPPQEVLNRLMRGNERFRSGQAVHPRQTTDWRQTVAAGQHPMAAILTCSDSRLPPEIVFDQGLGDLYVVRVAGNVATNVVVGSLELAVEALATSLIVVLGHDLCAAVAATLLSANPQLALPVVLPDAWHVGWIAQEAEAPGRIESLLAAIRPAMSGTPQSPAAMLEDAIKANVQFVVEQLSRTELIAARLAAGELAVVGAHYNLETGQVSLITG